MLCLGPFVSSDAATQKGEKEQVRGGRTGAQKNLKGRTGHLVGRIIGKSRAGAKKAGDSQTKF